ncbi:winged helix-turn-helix transcriptional regulator [Nocardia terpenica]|uniref:MarR family winged helix-turn-helix transcriptional regulator n=1 Tax=Nocardia terpenica TaxID=455432 RepID=UPI002FDF6241
MTELARADYASLLEFRTALRRFERWSEQQARQVGLTPAQHQLLLAIKGHAGEAGPTIRDVADSLVLRHHSVVGLVDRAVQAGLVARVPDATDSRAVRLVLTRAGERCLGALSELHLTELQRLAPILEQVSTALRAPPEGVPSR